MKIEDIKIITYEDALQNIGKRVKKFSLTSLKHNGEHKKKFKSDLYVNTVKGVIIHPILYVPAYTFIEDDSYVECRRCEVVND